MDKEELHWYAVRVYYNRCQPVADELEQQHAECFVPGSAAPSLLFVRCSPRCIADLGERHAGKLWVYRTPGSHQVALISDEEMEVFRFVVTAGQQGLTFLGDDKPEYHQGDRVAVIDGPFKGAEGHIRRIKRDRRLVVSIKGVVAVATTYIHPKFLKKLD